MHSDTILQIEDLTEGRSSAVELRRFFIQHAAKFAAIGAVCGFLPLGASLAQGGTASVWSLGLPLGLALALSFDNAREAFHFWRLLGQLEAAEKRIRAGQVVTVADIPALMRKGRPNSSPKGTDRSLRD